MKKDRLRKIGKLYKTAKALHSQSAGLYLEFLKAAKRLRAINERCKKRTHYYAITFE
jgi:hypothetical protein